MYKVGDTVIVIKNGIGIREGLIGKVISVSKPKNIRVDLDEEKFLPFYRKELRVLDHQERLNRKYNA